MSTTQSQTFNLSDVRSETEHLLKINSSYYFKICSLFWLPIFIFHMFYPSLHSYLSKLNPIFNTILPVFYIIFFLLIFLTFVGMIIHNSFHAFYGRPSTLVSDIKSLSSSFLPLLSTFFVSSCSLILPFGIIGFLICKLLETNDNNNITYESRYLSWITAILGMLLLAVRGIYLQVDWFLALVISVVESRWGYEPLRRSAYLIEGMRTTAFCLMILFGIFGGSYGYLVFFLLPTSWVVIWYLIFASMIMRNCVAATVVVYIYCMKMHGELAMEETVDEEIASPHYLRLPTNDNDGVHE